MDFQGFQSGISFWLIFSLLISVAVISWISYRKYSSIPSHYRILLSSLRAVSLLVICILLLNPLFTTNESRLVKPKVALLLDSSSSTSITKGNYGGTDTYSKLIDELVKGVKSTNVDLDTYSFGNSVSPTQIETFSNNEAITDIYETIEYLNTSDQNYTSAIIISDGIITRGKNPIIEAGNSTIPIHTIAIGDTQQVKDIRILDLVTNETGFTNTEHLVNVDISQFGFDYYSIDLVLKQSNNVIDQKSIDLNNQAVHSVTFKIALNEPGLQQFQLEIPSEENEWNTDNNRTSFSIEVLDSKTKILHLASAIHPDVKALRSILATNENIEIDELTFFGNSSQNRSLFTDITYDLVIVHGALPENWAKQYEQLLNETSTLFILLPNEESLSFKSNLTLLDNLSPELYNINFDLNASFSDHPILDLPDSDTQRFPPLLGPIRAEKSNLLTRSLLNATFQRINTDSPILAISESANIRRAHLNASGYYRYIQSTNDDARNYTIELLTNIVNWVSTNPDNRLLKLRLSKNDYSTGENPILNATLMNESGEFESGGIIELNVRGENYNSDFTFDNEGNGRYRLELPNLSPGKYTYTATASKGSSVVDTQNGEFFVNESNIELANTVRNDPLLKSIASNSNGLFREYTDINDYWNIISNHSDLETKTEIKERFIYPVFSIFWFVIVITLLSTEWLLRKKFALP